MVVSVYIYIYIIYKSYCFPNESLYVLHNKKWHWSPGRVLSLQALQRESWKCHPYCPFVFCPRWKPIQEETRQTGKKVHCLLCKTLETECENKWFSHQPEPVLENDKCKILLDFAIQTDNEIEQRRPDIVVIDKEKREWKIIDIVVPGDQDIKVKELNKITKYQDLRLQV